ncbi:hypothetical protein XH90_09380 [Bradyrhizobium sp. CCBAU 53338]|nr:hypothetical protein XH90_09380 [Bradyrhizobium sp. CCBAU 53338]
MRIRQANRWMDLNAGPGWIAIAVHNGRDDSGAHIDIADDYTVDVAEIDRALKMVASIDW